MRRHFEVGETAVTIISDGSFMKVAEDAVFEAREVIMGKIAEDPFFGITYDPYPPNDEDHDLIKRMCRSSVKAGVGPMAGIAGAIAVHAVEKMSEAGATFAIVDNGGDIALRIDRGVKVGIFQDDPKMNEMALYVPKRNGIFGICSSSGRIGPSVSFGHSGICTVFSDDVVLADACATALGNLIVKGEKQEMIDALDRMCGIDGVEGCMSSANRLFAVKGNVPELVKGTYGGSAITSILY